MLSNIIWWIFLQKRGGDPKIPQKRLRQFFCKWGGGVPKKRYFWSKNTIFNPISSLFRPFWSILRVLGPFLALCNTQMSQNGRISLGTPDLFILYIFLSYLLPCFPSCCRIRLSTVQPIILPYENLSQLSFLLVVWRARASSNVWFLLMRSLPLQGFCSISSFSIKLIRTFYITLLWFESQRN